MRTNLEEDPRTIAIRNSLRQRLATIGREWHSMIVVGALHRVWSWFLQFGVDGFMAGVAATSIDELVGIDGFGAAMAAQDWLAVEDRGIRMPDHDKWNWMEIRKRSAEANRKRKQRAKDALDVTPQSGTHLGQMPNVTLMSRSGVGHKRDMGSDSDSDSDTSPVQSNYQERNLDWTGTDGERRERALAVGRLVFHLGADKSLAWTAALAPLATDDLLATVRRAVAEVDAAPRVRDPAKLLHHILTRLGVLPETRP